MRKPTRTAGSVAAMLVAAVVTFSASEPALQADASASGVPESEAFDLEEATIADIRDALADGSLSCVSLVQRYLDRIERYEDSGYKLNAITTVNSDALKAAASLDAEYAEAGPRGDLHCIPTLLKDNVDTADMPTSNGSVIMRESMPPDDAFIVDRLRQAGALILGKASMGEFAGSPWSTLDGQMVNPYHRRRDTGGSSSGSGSAVAANLAVLAVGTDTSTSVRGPASYNGIVGLRPTTGLISRDGIVPKNLLFDTAGPMARTVTDTALMLETLTGRGGDDPRNEGVYDTYPERLGDGDPDDGISYTRHLQEDSLEGARLGVVRDFFGGDPEIDKLAQQALRTMEERGATLVDITLDPDFLRFYVENGDQNIREIADYRFQADFETYLATLPPDIPKTVEELIHSYEAREGDAANPVAASVLDELLKDSLKHTVDDPKYVELVDDLLPAATRYKRALFAENDLDALVFPYETAFATPIDNPVTTVDDPTYTPSDVPSPSIFAGYSSVGFPGVVVPMGIGSEGLPMTMQFMGLPYSEGKLLGYAYSYEQASRKREPSPLMPPLER